MKRRDHRRTLSDHAGLPFRSYWFQHFCIRQYSDPRRYVRTAADLKLFPAESGARRPPLHLHLWISPPQCLVGIISVQ